MQKTGLRWRSSHQKRPVFQTEMYRLETPVSFGGVTNRDPDAEPEPDGTVSAVRYPVSRPESVLLLQLSVGVDKGTLAFP